VWLPRTTIYYIFAWKTYGLQLTSNNSLRKVFTFLQSKTTFLGAVGAYNFAGSVMKFERSYKRQRDMLQYSRIAGVLPNFTTNSYLGKRLQIVVNKIGRSKPRKVTPISSPHICHYAGFKINVAIFTSWSNLVLHCTFLLYLIRFMKKSCLCVYLRLFHDSENCFEPSLNFHSIRLFYYHFL